MTNDEIRAAWIERGNVAKEAELRIESDDDNAQVHLIADLIGRSANGITRGGGGGAQRSRFKPSKVS